MPRTDSYETDLLVHLFRDRKALAKFSDRLRPEHFLNEIKGDIWEIVRGLWHEFHEQITFAAVEAKVIDAINERPPIFNEEDLPAVTSVLERMLSDDAVMGKWLESDLHTWLIQREYAVMRDRISDALMDGRPDEVDAIYREVTARVNTFESEELDFFENMVEISITYAEFVKDRVIPTGLVNLDQLLAGGLLKGEFGIIWGAENVGKSFAANFIAKSAIEDGRRVLHISNEMSVRDIYARYATLFTGVPTRDFGDSEQMKVVKAKQEELKDYKGKLVVRYAPPGSTVDFLWGTLEAAKIDGKPFDMVIVDYLDQFVPTEKTTQDWLAIEKMCGEFSAVAKPELEGGMDVCLVAISHSDAQAAGKSTANHNMMGRSKMGKGKVIDFSLFLGQTKEESLNNIIWCTIVKVRNKGNKNARCAFLVDYDVAMFYPLEDIPVVGGGED